MNRTLSLRVLSAASARETAISAPVNPATDLSVAWMLLPSSARPAFRAAAGGSIGWIDDHTWMRARGWALLLGLASLASSRDDDVTGTLGRATLEAVLCDNY